ncbi:MAG: alkaline phosphatase [Saprospiraceae bacterium]|nr:alkaline phosphatase [Lewinella sp.]
MQLFRTIFAAVALLLIGACQPTKTVNRSATTAPKNIILLIGDGMGLTQVSTSFYFSDQPSNFARFKHIGLHQNTPTDAKITDSASGATAFSTGFKTYNAAIGVDSDTMPQKTILEIAAAQGKSTGLVATSSITHATPAAFFAHVANRNSHEDIAADFMKTSVDFTAGGGLKFYHERSDRKDFLPELAGRGYQIDTSTLGQHYDASKPYIALLAADGLPKMTEGRGDFLPKATQMALQHLSQNKKGFFLMVEGSQIDWGGHANDGTYVIEEMKDFDKTIGLALDFAEKDGNTLVVVTADHETGGLALSSLQAFGRSDYGQINPTFSTGGHTAALIPVFAYGPGAERFMGIYQNNDIFGKMMEGFVK